MIAKMKEQITAIEEAIRYAEETDTAWHPNYTKLVRARRTLKKMLRKLEKMEASW